MHGNLFFIFILIHCSFLLRVKNPLEKILAGRQLPQVSQIRGEMDVVVTWPPRKQTIKGKQKLKN